MASTEEPDLKCPICHDFFTDPVILSCSHSFCRVCEENWRQHSQTCAVCKKTCKRHRHGPPLNRNLRNLVETYKKRASEQPECGLHPEKLRLFCEDHQEPVCLVCIHSEAHTDHRFTPIEEAAPDLREELRSSMEPLLHKLQALNKKRVQFDDAVAHITAQAQRTEDQMRAKFQELHLFLWLEEKSRKKALKEEEEQKTQDMKDKMAAVSREIEAVSKTISDTEELLRAADASFLLQYKTAAERVQQCYLVKKPKMKQGALINQAKHLGNLGFKVWKKMKTQVQFSSVVLDPNTAGPCLIISEDLRAVRRGERQKVPNNLERLLDNAVFGSVGFVSGTHSWDVDISENKTWAVGVGTRVQRGIWCINYRNNEYTASSSLGLRKPLSVKNLQRVRVKLDCDRKSIRFTDPATNTHLHTFTDAFIGEMRPAFVADTALKILPSDVTMKLFSQPGEHQTLNVVGHMAPVLLHLVHNLHRNSILNGSVTEAGGVRYANATEINV